MTKELNTPHKILIVRGEQGCGKTKNKDAMVRMFGIDHVVDDVGANLFQRPHMHNMKTLRNMLPKEGRVLLLTCAPKLDVMYVMMRHFPDVQSEVFEFADIETDLSK